MANKKDVSNAFYQGVCAVLLSANVADSLCESTLEIDTVELGQFIDENPEFEELRHLTSTQDTTGDTDNGK